MSFIGLIVIGVLACMKRVHVYHGRLYGAIGHNWGGYNMGCFFICCEEGIGQDYLCAHECGHGLQNCLWGPLFPFVIMIPSVIRFWYREFKYNRKGLQAPTEYGDIWFEGQASRWGEKYVVTDIF